MYITPEQIQNANKAAIEAALTLAEAQFATIERLATLNASTIKDVFYESLSDARALLGAKDAQEYEALQNALAAPTIEKAVAYCAGIYEVATEAQRELSKVVENQVASWNDSVTSALDEVAKNTPAGFDFGLIAVKSFVVATSSACENIRQAAKQADEVADESIAEATIAAKNFPARSAKPRRGPNLA